MKTLKEEIIGYLDNFLDDFMCPDGSWKTHEKYADAILKAVREELPEEKKENRRNGDRDLEYFAMGYNQALSDIKEKLV